MFYFKGILHLPELLFLTLVVYDLIILDGFQSLTFLVLVIDIDVVILLVILKVVYKVSFLTLVLILQVLLLVDNSVILLCENVLMLTKLVVLNL